ncbi:MAG: TolC family protein [Deltaproteobacteria bacterium]|nr:TolC family protein [Deltaproteobacteria bacterium]
MDRGKPGRNELFLVALTGALLIAGSLIADGAGREAPPAKRAAAPPRLSISNAVAISLARNLRMAEGRLSIQEKEHQRREAYSDFFPTLDLQYIAEANRYQQAGNIQAFAGSQDARAASIVTTPGTLAAGFRDQVMSDYPYRIDPYRTFLLNATLTQPLFTAGKLLNNYKYARLGVDFQELQLEVTRQDLILDVYEAYYQLLQSQKLLEVANQSIIALESLRNQTMEFYKAGVVPKVDVLSTEGQLAQARIQKTQAQTDIERYRAALNFLLRYPQETPTQIVEDMAYIPSPYGIPEIYRTAAGNRIEIRQANISVEQALSLVKAAQADLIPQINIQVSGTRMNDDWNPFDPEAVNDWSVKGIAAWTLDMFRTRETVKERRASQAKAFVARELLVEQIMQDVKQAYADMKRSESDIFNNKKAVEFRTESFRINRERYKEQVATYTEVLDAQRELAQAQGDYYISLIQYRINRALLERRMGTLR